MEVVMDGLGVLLGDEVLVAQNAVQLPQVGLVAEQTVFEGLFFSGKPTS